MVKKANSWCVTVFKQTKSGVDQVVIWFSTKEDAEKYKQEQIENAKSAEL